MSFRTCFVVMPIGDQAIGAIKITASDLKARYDDLIKEAILRANPYLDVLRADEVSAPGMITTDIITRIMHSDIVIVDVTYPNPNVFYELGLRHACRPGTIIIRDDDGPIIPFDIAHLRFISYQNTPTGLKGLSDKLKQYFDYIAENPGKPDNQLLEFAKLTGYSFQNYAKQDYTEQDAMLEIFPILMQSPEGLNLLARMSSGEQVDKAELFQEIFKSSDTAIPILKALVKSGAISTAKPQETSSKTGSQTKKKRKKR